MLEFFLSEYGFKNQRITNMTCSIYRLSKFSPVGGLELLNSQSSMDGNMVCWLIDSFWSIPTEMVLIFSFFLPHFLFRICICCQCSLAAAVTIHWFWIVAAADGRDVNCSIDENTDRTAINSGPQSVVCEKKAKLRLRKHGGTYVWVVGGVGLRTFMVRLMFAKRAAERWKLRFGAHEGGKHCLLFGFRTP